MSTWANRAKAHFLQKGQNSTTETTETPLLTVLTVHSGRLCEKYDSEIQCELAENDTAPTTTVQIEGKATTPDNGTVRPPDLYPALLAASLALDAQIAADDGLLRDPYSDCYPHSTAMNTAELDLFEQRVRVMQGKGLTRADAETFADRLVQRDRDDDDRRLCLECKHLGGYGVTSWRCGNWEAAKVAHRAQDSKLPADLVLQLQRCNGFKGATV